MGEAKPTKTKKRGSIATKIIVVIIVMVLVSGVASTLTVVFNAKTYISEAVQNNMLGMATSYAKAFESVKQEYPVMIYEIYDGVVGETKVEGMPSSYIYVVSKDGEMLYHPTREKVGKPVENSVVKGLTERLQAGETPDPDSVTYEYKGEEKYASYAILTDGTIVVVTADASDAMAGINKTATIAFIILGVMLVISIVLAIIICRLMIKPLVKLSEAVDEVAGGNLNADFSGVKKTKDEIGLISEKVQEMVASFKGVLDKIRETSDIMSQNSSDLNTTSEQTLAANGEISRAVEDVAEGSTNMATSIIGISDNLGTMNDETQTINSSVVEIKHQTQSVQESSAIMNQKIHHMQESTNKMDEGISIISERVQKVNSVVDKVSDIVSVIEEISGQTNLLSLNASIEAARAGEAGKGFAVVAEEIRVLSDNTNSELNNIKDIISELVSECDACVKASNTVVEDNAVQKTEISAVLEEFANLDEQIEFTSEKAEEIKNLVEAMVNLNTEITEGSDGLTEVSSANAAATKQMTANIEELNAMMNGVAEMASQTHDQSANLTEALAYFK